MSRIVSLLSAHPLVGQWVVQDDQSSTLYTIQAEAGSFAVTADDQRDDKALEVSDVGWDGTTLRFSLAACQHVLSVLPDGTLDDHVVGQSHATLVRRAIAKR